MTKWNILQRNKKTKNIWQSEKWENNSFACIFQRFQYLIAFMLLVKPTSTVEQLKSNYQKICEIRWDKCKQKKKTKKLWKSRFLLHVDFICTDFLVHQLVNKSRWVKFF